MDRDFRKGHLETDFLTTPFTSPFPLLRDAVGVFFTNLPFLAAATLVVYVPGKLATQFLCYLLDVPFDGLLSYFFLEISDLLLSAVVLGQDAHGEAEAVRPLGHLDGRAVAVGIGDAGEGGVAQVEADAEDRHGAGRLPGRRRAAP